MISQLAEAPRGLRLLTEARPSAELPLSARPHDADRPRHVGLVGRERELAALHAMVEKATETGSALLVRGGPGIGKSALVEAVTRDLARSVGLLRASGIPAEASMPYAGLHQLLRPILGELGSLQRAQRRALEVALGVNASPLPDPQVIAIATLDLLSIAARSRLLIVVEDAHWLDRQTSKVLSFVARRLSSDPIVLLVTARDDRRSPILDAGLAELRLGPLADQQATRLLATAHPGMAESVQQRLIHVATGNPLALLELPATLTTEQLGGRAALPESIPLTARVQHAVDVRIRELPLDTRRLLRLLALDGVATVADLLEAYVKLHPDDDPATHDALLSAVVAGAIVLHGPTAAYRDQLIRTAVYQGTSTADRRSAQAALAAARRGPAPDRAEVPRHVVDDTDREKPGDATRSLVALREATTVDTADPSMASHLVDLASGAIDDGDQMGVRRLLWAAAQHILWQSGDQDARLAARRVAARTDAEPDDPWLLAISAALGSADTLSITEVVGRYEGLDVAASDLLLLGIAAAMGGDIEQSRLLLARAAPALRGDDDRAQMAQLLVTQSWNDIHLGRWGEAAAEIAQGAQLARETQQTAWSRLADIAGALVASLRGDDAAVDIALASAGSTAPGRRHGLLASTIEVVRGISDLHAGRADASYARLRDQLTSGDGEATVWAIDYLADAAVLVRQVDDAREVLVACRDATDGGRGPLQEAAMTYASAVLGDESTADEDLTRAIADLTPWPVHRARLQLHRGAWLRRHRRAADSRAPLRPARDLFEALGAAPLAERARRELRASGERIRQRDITAWDELSPQEAEIAQMAAQGLSNREIGEQLFLSHRTVGAHLYRVFPKLGVTSRGQLHTVLAVGQASGISATSQ